MSFLKLVSQRQSARRYEGRVPETDKLDRILEAARMAHLPVIRSHGISSS